MPNMQIRNFQACLDLSRNAGVALPVGGMRSPRRDAEISLSICQRPGRRARAEKMTRLERLAINVDDPRTNVSSELWPPVYKCRH